MKKAVLLVFILLCTILLANAYEYNLLTQKEKVTAEAIPITSADIVNVAQAEALPFLYVLGGLLVILYGLLFYKHRFFSKIGKTLKNYEKYITQIIRIVIF